MRLPSTRCAPRAKQSAKRGGTDGGTGWESRTEITSVEQHAGKAVPATHRPSFITLLAAPILTAPCLRFAGAQGKRPGWRPEPRRGEGITSRRNGGSLDKATVTLVDRFQYCWPGTPHSAPGWEDGRAPRPWPCPRDSLGWTQRDTEPTSSW